MSLAVEFKLERDTATKAVQHVLDTLEIDKLTALIGPPCVDLTQKHLGKYKNRKNWPSTGFGEEAADHTYFAPTGQGPVIVINKQGARQLYKGGHIPRGGGSSKRFLIFAIAAESYGKTRAQMGYKPKRDGGNPANNKRINSLFAFVPKSKGVDQKPHPDLIPSQGAYSRLCFKKISNAIRVGSV